MFVMGANSVEYEVLYDDNKDGVEVDSDDGDW